MYHGLSPIFKENPWPARGDSNDSSRPAIAMNVITVVLHTPFLYVTCTLRPYHSTPLCMCLLAHDSSGVIGSDTKCRSVSETSSVEVRILVSSASKLYFYSMLLLGHDFKGRLIAE